MSIYFSTIAINLRGWKECYGVDLREGTLTSNYWSPNRLSLIEQII
jgi:hypothetical protein